MAPPKPTTKPSQVTDGLAGRASNSAELLAKARGFVRLPSLHWWLLAVALVCYVVLTQLVKTWYYRRFAE